jgi:hypothetical protein
MDSAKKKRFHDELYSSPPAPEPTPTTTSAPVRDIAALESDWSPDRHSRPAMKVVSIEPHSTHPEDMLRGGIFVLNAIGDGATLSFGFQFGNEKFGLTVETQMDTSISRQAGHDRLYHHWLRRLRLERGTHKT